MTAYDAAYLALAEALGATLLTRDSRLARAPGHSARVELVSFHGRRRVRLVDHRPTTSTAATLLDRINAWRYYLEA